MTESTHTEVIPPYNGKTEDKLVLWGSISVFIVAFLLLNVLYSHHHLHENNALVPKPIAQTMMSLTNAAEELALIVELEGNIPSLENIVSLGISPFNKSTLAHVESMQWQQYDGCFLSELIKQKETYHIRLNFLQNSSEAYQLSWRLKQNNDPLNKTNCYENTHNGWQLLDKFNRLQGENHAH